MWAVCRIHGIISSPTDEVNVNNALTWTPHVGWIMESLFDNWERYLYRDDHVTYVNLLHVGVDDQWLWRLRRFSNLEIVVLDGGIAGPGLHELAALPKLKEVQVVGWLRTRVDGRIDSTITGSEFLLLPQVESLLLIGFNGPLDGLAQLKDHSKLRQISLAGIARLGDVLCQLEECKNIDTLAILDVTTTHDDTLKGISRLSFLKTLILRASNKSNAFESSLNDVLPTTKIVWVP